MTVSLRVRLFASSTLPTEISILRVKLFHNIMYGSNAHCRHVVEPKISILSYLSCVY